MWYVSSLPQSLLTCQGMVWQACKEIYRDGAGSYFRNIYNAMDFFMLQFYMASIALRRVTERTVTPKNKEEIV